MEATGQAGVANMGQPEEVQLRNLTDLAQHPPLHFRIQISKTVAWRNVHLPNKARSHLRGTQHRAGHAVGGPITVEMVAMVTVSLSTQVKISS